MAQYLYEALKKLDALDEEMFSLSEEDMERFQNVLENGYDDVVDSVDIYDPEISDSDISLNHEELPDIEEYRGDIVLMCPTCRSFTVKDREELNYEGSEEDDEHPVVCPGILCPVCGHEDGFYIIGKLDSLGDDEESVEDDSEEDESEIEASDEGEIEDVSVEDEDESEDDQDEGYGESLETKQRVGALKENYKRIMESKREECLDSDLQEATRQEKEYRKSEAGQAMKKKDRRDSDRLRYLQSKTSAMWLDDDSAENDEDSELISKYKEGSRKPNLLSANHFYKDTEDGDIVFDDDKYNNYNFVDKARKSEDRYNKNIDLKYHTKTADANARYNRMKDLIAYRNASKKRAEDEYAKHMKYADEQQDEIDNMLRKNESLDDSSLTEDINNIDLTTDEETVHVEQGDNGALNINIEPVEDVDTGDVVVAPLNDGDKGEIETAIIDNAEEEEEPLMYTDKMLAGEEEEEPIEEPIGEPEELSIEEPEEDEEEDEIDDTEFESLQTLISNYLTEVYDNVTKFEISNSSMESNKIVAEGLITFTSGNSKKTSFIFESSHVDSLGRYVLRGLNENICKGRKPFTLRGSIENKTLKCESLTYNYKQKNEQGRAIRVYGTVK